ncbi:MAG: aminotransferase class III-fold pyridoxal phosphate-dependent enzyme [Deltaproteobacteria bacterium]|jgi:4-aminobutyrate aminotransferase|nr:aminotransferase class III-fold pyridoxal phosphate-dependent enzyme [Deltaproteobacteria bacterium]
MAYVEKKTPVCDALVERDKKAIAKCNHLSYYNFVVESGNGSILKDHDGYQYIDFLTSASSLNTGVNHPKVKAAVQAQLEKFTQYTAAYTYNQPAIEYAEKLNSVYPGQVPAKVCFGNCGSDSNDAAIKFSRAYQSGKKGAACTKIITFIDGYHGNTYGSSSLSTCTTRMRDKMGPFLPDIFHFPFYAETDEKHDDDYFVKEIKQAFATYLPPDEVAAIIIEPIQGDAGLLSADHRFMKALYNLCQEHNILFISEEVQQAFGRAGYWFSIEAYGIVPDGIIMGKSIGGGLTLGAFMAKAEIMECLPAPAHLFTLGANAIACAAGSAQFDVIKEMLDGPALGNITAVMNQCLAKLKQDHPRVVGKISGANMSRGVYITLNGHDGPATQADKDACFKILFDGYNQTDKSKNGLIMISLAANVLRIQPALTITAGQLEEGFKIIGEAMTKYENGEIPDSVLRHRAGW